MSDAEKDLIREYYAVWAAGDVAAMLERAHTDIEAMPTLGVLYDHSVYQGHEGISAWFEEVAGRWKGFDPHVDDVVEHHGKVIAFIRLSARRSDQPVDARIAVEHTFRDGRMV